ncbi:T9SS type A sorting domain-containing protein [Dysgonomonas sp. 520]|uniref:T9SS type A sorting domain-containing protein n=1 Tax=Dysgonomonas sp. 520 TaxID=2302931 RepID=UPI0013D7E7D6|nr:T9SS type A sorting domain-containing protein [Dysgonomonas sp. 520]NDW10899.1 T9SS C-terminal target domain-containing protein [Dysgonomonas sp. 520]
MKTTKLAGMAVVLFMLLLWMSGLATLQAQPTTGPGVDPNALLLMDFEDGDVTGWTTNTIGRGEKVSVELMDADNGDPVRFGRYAVKLNWDLTEAQSNQTLACLYSPPGDAYVIPASSVSQRKIGMWIYASPECEKNIWFRLQQFTPPGSTPGVDAGYITVFGNEISYTYWTGWKYHEFIIPADHTNKKMGPPSKTTPSYGMFRLLQAGSGTGGKQLTKGYFIIDNIRVTTVAEDVSKPTISSLTGNGTALSGATLQTGAITLSAAYSDTGGSAESSGINASSACFTVDGVLYKTGDANFTSDATTATLTGLKLRNGTHTVVAHVEDNFGNMQTSTATFTVDDPSVEATTITLVPDNEAHVGNMFEMKINTNKSQDIKELDITIELGTLGSIDATNGVVFAPSVTNKSFNFNTTSRQLTIHLENDHTASAVETLATIKINIPESCISSDAIRCNPVLSTAKYSDDVTEPFSLFAAFSKPALSTYNFTVLKRIVGTDGEVLVTDLSGNPVSGATVYANSISGTTDANGVALFNFTTSQQAIDMYAGKDGKFSYTSIVRTLTPQLTNIPSSIRSGTTIDPTTSKTIVWMSNPVTTLDPVIIKIAKKADGESSFVQHTGISEILEFDAGNAVTKGSKVTVTGLEPGTDYIYQLGDGTNWSPTREFTTTTVTNKFSFSAYGDLQATSTSDMAHWLAAATTLEALPTKPFFSLNVGDIVDNDNNWGYHSYYSQLFDQRSGFANIDLTAAYGNHEYMGTENAKIIKFLNAHPTLQPSPNYDIDKIGDGSYATVYGNMLVIGLDWEHKGGGYTALARQTEQAKWMDEVMTLHADKTWKIVTLHYEIPNSSFTSTALATLGPVLDKHNVQIVFCGHGHTFRRVQVKNNVWTPSSYTRTAAPVKGAGTMHWQLGGMRPSDGNSQRWVFGEVDGKKITFTVRNGSNEIVDNECFTLYASEINNYAVNFNTVSGNGTLTATVDGTAITTGNQIADDRYIVFTATPDTDYKVKEWKLNGSVVGDAKNTFTLFGLEAASTITVEFEYNKVGIEDVSASDLTISPNPFADVVRIANAEDSTLQIMDVTGTMVHSQKIAGAEETIRLENLSSGVYFFHVKKDGQAKTVKMIKK